MISAAKLNQITQNFSNRKPVASGLPAYVYTSEEYWQQEQRTLFTNSWVFVGFAHELKNIGDVMPLEIAGQPIFLIRSSADEIKAFHNVCRHRCLKLIDENCNVGPRIRCPYHSWVYGLSGELKSTPFFAGSEQHTPDGFDPGRHALVQVSCGVWFDWIFINLSGTATPFEQHIQPLKKRLADVDFDQVKPVATVELGEVKCNWKLLLENFIEPYHVQFVHASTTDQPLKDHYTVIDEHCLGSAVDIDDTAQVKKQNTLAVSSLYLTLFPNFVFGRYFPDQMGVHLDIPLSVDRTRQKRVIYTTDGEPRSDEEITSLKTLWYDVHKEDHEMCERLQQGRASVIAEQGGLLSPHWEDSVRRFQELALDATINV